LKSSLQWRTCDGAPRERILEPFLLLSLRGSQVNGLMRVNDVQAIRIHSLDGIDALRLEEAELPALDAGQIKIAVHAAGCNFADTLQIQGLYQTKPPLPFSPGLEVAGEVIEVASNVTGLTVGQRVMGWVPWGGYASEAIMSAWAAVPVPDAMDWVTAASFPISYATAYGALSHHRVALQKGETLLVHGAGGGVGLAAVEVGKAMGATVVATAGSQAKLDLAADHGASAGVNYSSESVRERVKALVGGVDVVLDPVGGDVFQESLRCTNTDGRLVVIGFAAGTIQQIASNYLLLKNISVAGYAFSIYSRGNHEHYRNLFEGLARMYVDGALRPHISAVLPLAETAEALRMLVERRATGKVVVQVR
jgi:NADPH:quinone reductase